MIHVLIEQAKDLKIDAEETVDPIVEVKCLVSLLLMKYLTGMLQK